MGLFNSPDKEMRRQFETQMDAQLEGQELQTAQAMAERGNIAYDPQVSALILERDRRFLNWVPDFKSNQLILDMLDRGLVEPYGDEPLSFVAEGEEKKLVTDADSLMASIYSYMRKYGRDDKTDALFNKIARFRISVLNNSRSTGKPGKLAKSQFVSTSSDVIRFNNPDAKTQDKFLGLF